MSPIARKVLLALKKIPKDRVTTYGILAEMFNTSPRAVGQIMKRNPDPADCPCYKVVKSSGEVGGYAGKIKGDKIREKIEKLRKDGIVVENGMIGRKYFWRFK